MRHGKLCYYIISTTDLGMSGSPIALCSISWIDEKPLPKVGFWFVAGASISWPKRVIMGLVGTANPEPPLKLPSVAAFRARMQYRALLSCATETQAKRRITDVVVDAGYTPPFDKSKLDTRLRDVAPIPDDPKSYPGESSSVSGISVGKLHPCSTLAVPGGHEIIISALIKFRAGQHTDNIGIDKANSPMHVPWVWCEYALISSGSRWRLLAQGSTFPSHAWYVNGSQVAKRLQSPITVSENDPAISTGEPVVSGHDPMRAQNDKSTGSVTGHDYTIAGDTPFDVDVTRFIL
jgi:hypothetical protein